MPSRSFSRRDSVTWVHRGAVTIEGRELTIECGAHRLDGDHHALSGTGELRGGLDRGAEVRGDRGQRLDQLVEAAGDGVGERDQLVDQVFGLGETLFQLGGHPPVVALRGRRFKA